MCLILNKIFNLLCYISDFPPQISKLLFFFSGAGALKNAVMNPRVP